LNYTPSEVTHFFGLQVGSVFKSFSENHRMDLFEILCVAFSRNAHITQNESSCMLKLFKAFLCIVSTNDFDDFDDEQNSIK
jgi:hypothetical protein